MQVSLSNPFAVFIRRVYTAGFSGQFLHFSVVGIDGVSNAVCKKLGCDDLADPAVPGKHRYSLTKADQEITGQTD